MTTARAALDRALTEAEWQAQVIDLARLLGWRCAHFRTARTSHGWRTPVAADGAGWPDLALCRERVIYVELKGERGKLSDDQRAWLDALRAAGAEAYCWRPSDWDEVLMTLTERRPA